MSHAKSHLEDLIVLQRYRSMDEFCRAKHCHIQMLPKPRETWRLVDKPVLGSINGLERKFRGLAVATNGIIVAIETSASTVLFAHLQWFYKDDPEAETDLDLDMVEVLRQRRKMQTLDTFNDLFTDETI